MQLNANQVIIQRDIIDTFSSFISVGFASERNNRLNRNFKSVKNQESLLSSF